MTRVTRYTRLFQLRNNTYPLCRFSKVYVLSLAKGNLETRVTHVTRATVYALAAIYLTTPRRLYKRAIPRRGWSFTAGRVFSPPACAQSTPSGLQRRFKRLSLSTDTAQGRAAATALRGVLDVVGSALPRLHWFGGCCGACLPLGLSLSTAASNWASSTSATRGVVLLRYSDNPASRAAWVRVMLGRSPT